MTIRTRWGSLALFTTIAALVLLPSAAPVQAQGQGAEVIVDDFCVIAFNGPDGFTLYTGGATTLTTPSGRISGQCHADILFGPGVSETLRGSGTVSFLGAGLLSCDGVFTVSGNANMRCRN